MGGWVAMFVVRHWVRPSDLSVQEDKNCAYGNQWVLYPMGTVHCAWVLRLAPMHNVQLAHCACTGNFAQCMVNGTAWVGVPLEHSGTHPGVFH